MEKNFDEWNSVKKKTDLTENNPIFYEREIWHCKIGLNIGFEQNGKGADFSRPVLIVKKFNTKIFLGIPLTKKEKTGKYYYNFENSIGKSTAILSQIKLTDSCRLINKIAYISKHEFDIIKHKIRTILF